MQEKTSNTKQQACWKMKDTSDQNRDEWSVQCYAVLDPSLWISGVLYRVFVSGLRGLVRLPVHPQWSRSLWYVHASICRSHAFVQCFQSFPVFVYLKKFCQYSLQSVFLNSKKLFFKALSPSLNARYIASVLSLHKKLFFYNNIICFCLETQEMYQKLNIIRY